MDTFSACQVVNNLLAAGNEDDARNELIKILDRHEKEKRPYNVLLNHLIRETGLYPYLDINSADWQDRFVYESFKVDVGAGKKATLHREQSSLLKRLLSGESLAVSAPTSFGKSFVIDAFIAIKKPTNIVIVVPTLALTDETRRRLHKKFSGSYKIITTTDEELGEKNILIFPQERAIHYENKIDQIDILIIDEFYKASPKFDKERSPALLKAILKLGAKSRQKYFLAPNISRLQENPFTEGMSFVALNFNTVFLEKHELYKKIRGSEVAKSGTLLNILRNSSGKTLIYAGTYSNIERLSTLLIDSFDVPAGKILHHFEKWLTQNYAKNWNLTKLVKRSTGIHNGQLHRSLTQIQVKLFEEKEGLKNIISTSSIIEGVNTSAENVVIWSNKKGRPLLDDFTYRNIIGRGGRMFKHFIGKIYILEAPPAPKDTQLDLALPDELLGDIDEVEFKESLTPEQIAKIIQYKNEMADILGPGTFESIKEGSNFQSSDSFLLRKIAYEIKKDPLSWRGLSYLNSANPESWDRMLYKIINLQPGGWEIEYGKFVAFIKILSHNWEENIPTLLRRLDAYDIGIDMLFKLERNSAYKLASLLNDVNIIQRAVLKDKTIDISPFVAKISKAFLPSCVYQLEEYGLPRMISKKIHKAKILDFTAPSLTVHQAIASLIRIGELGITRQVADLDYFDKYILSYFFEGVSVEKPANV